MKKRILLIISSGIFLFSGCVDLNQNPLYYASTENWFSDEDEFTMSVNNFYRHTYWYFEVSRFSHTDRWTDDWNQRDYLYDWLQGSYTSDFPQVHSAWFGFYGGVTRANTVLSKVHDMRGKGTIAEDILDVYEGEACFFRACFYAYLVFLWGDVPFYTEYLFLEDAYQMGRTDKAVVMEQVYKDFDRAAVLLPPSYPTLFSKENRITKGAAYGFKARAAIWMSDWATAAKAAKDCMDLGVYSLHPSFRTLFLSSTRVSPEYIFVLPRSKEIMNDAEATSSRMPRNSGGTATAQPSWELMCSYLCTDGKPIDKSNLYDPKNPFNNRDPRMAETMVEFGTEFLGYIWSPGTKSVKNVTTGATSSDNRDSRLLYKDASYNGMTLKKGVDETWQDGKDSDYSYKILRYADVLLMYAEAKMELNQIDNTVLAAINDVRSRAYNDTGLAYPKVTTTNQDELRTIIRMERRMEFAWENRRWFDLIRWRLAEVACDRPIYCHPQTTELETIINSGNYFFPPVLPKIDKDGLVDLSPLYNYKFTVMEGGKEVEKSPIIIINQRSFNPRQYLMPIPDTELMICPNLVQNDDY